MRCWLNTNLRMVIALALTAMVCYLAWAGEADARAALVSTFGVLAGSIYGERSALKQPGGPSAPG